MLTLSVYLVLKLSWHFLQDFSQHNSVLQPISQQILIIQVKASAFSTYSEKNSIYALATI